MFAPGPTKFLNEHPCLPSHTVRWWHTEKMMRMRNKDTKRIQSHLVAQIYMHYSKSSRWYEQRSGSDKDWEMILRGQKKSAPRWGMPPLATVHLPSFREACSDLQKIFCCDYIVSNFRICHQFTKVKSTTVVWSSGMTSRCGWRTLLSPLYDPRQPGFEYVQLQLVVLRHS